MFVLNTDLLVGIKIEVQLLQGVVGWWEGVV